MRTGSFLSHHLSGAQCCNLLKWILWALKLQGILVTYQNRKTKASQFLQTLTWLDGCGFISDHSIFPWFRVASTPVLDVAARGGGLAFHLFGSSWAWRFLSSIWNFKKMLLAWQKRKQNGTTWGWCYKLAYKWMHRFNLNSWDVGYHVPDSRWEGV